ncbi:hypothetical protein [Hymenobacter bucti]|uniref:Uncharacterized protein n=1 Tax=Hymenobacter bucti TaxID=1844114 RepID=A0ABW4R0Y6_9BACT
MPTHTTRTKSSRATATPTSTRPWPARRPGTSAWQSTGPGGQAQTSGGGSPTKRSGPPAGLPLAAQ